MGRRRLVAELRFPPVRLDLVIKISALYAPFAQYIRIQHGLCQSQRRPFWRPKDPIQLTPERADLAFQIWPRDTEAMESYSALFEMATAKLTDELGGVLQSIDLHITTSVLAAEELINHDSNNVPNIRYLQLVSYWL